jgi:hypothetical protein
MYRPTSFSSQLIKGIMTQNIEEAGTAQQFTRLTTSSKGLKSQTSLLKVERENK